MSLSRYVLCALWAASLAVFPGVAHGQRQMESLGRGVVVLRTSSTQTYVSWRMLGNDPLDIAFNLYRSPNGTAAVKINASPITATTDYADTPPNLGTTVYTYSVKPVLNGVEVADAWANQSSGSVTLPLNAPVRQYLPVTLQPTPDGPNSEYIVKFAWVGDLDGDGEYDFVVDRTNTQTAARQWIQAYKRDGTLLWQMTQGPNSVEQDNVYPGSSAISVGHNDNVTVYDLDGDGKSEVIVLTANSVIFNYGMAGQTTLTAANDELQYISVIDGETGVEKERAQVPIPIAWANQNHVSGHFGVLYSDGIRPSFIFQYANRNPSLSFNKTAATWDYRNGQLTQRWVWDPTGHVAEAHQIRIADVNNDGRDEYVDIGHVVKADGSGQINGDKLTEVVHGDRFHITDIDPDHPGLETFLIQQDNPTGLTTMYHAADKSGLIKKWYAGSVVDVGRGTVGGFVSSLSGLQFFSTVGGTFDCKGNEIFATSPFPTETIWWDANPGRELLNPNGVAIDKFSYDADGATGYSRIFSIYNDPAVAPTFNYQADGGRPAFWGDVIGDWREELVCVSTDNSELRMYITKTPDTAKTFNGQNFRIPTLMHDPQYRCQTTTKGYVQSSYPGFYLGYNMPPPPPAPMVDTKLVWKGGAAGTTWDAGSTASWLNNGAASVFTDGDSVRFDISGGNSYSITLNGTLQPGALTVYSPKDYTFTGAGTFAGTMNFLKSGAGSLTLPNTHTFTGKTTVWDGALVVNGNLQGSPVTVWGGTWGGAAVAGKTGGRLAGIGQFSQPVTLKYRGAITPGAGMNSAGTLTFANGLTAEDGTAFALDLSDDPTGTTKPNDRIAVTGDLSLGGTVKIVVNPLDATLTPGTYILAAYTGTLIGGLENLAIDLPGGTPYMLTAGSGAIQLTIIATRPAASTKWRGTGTDWDLATSQNWLNGGSPDVFVSGDQVTFDSTGAAAPTVALATTLPVSGLTVSADSDYTFNGLGSIAGSGGLTKSGTGTLTVNQINSYNGPTIINGGVLAVAALGDAGSPSSIGASTGDAGNLVINGGILRLTGAQTHSDRNATLGASGATIDITAADSSIQLSGILSGGGTLVKSGAGILLLAAANTYTGGTVINGGKVYLAGSTANKFGLGTGKVTINNGTLSMVDVQNNDVAGWNLIVPAGAIARLDADGRCSLTGSLTGSGDFTFHTPYIRTDLKGNWSAFNGRISASGPEFRIANSFGLANAAIDFGGNMSAYYNLTMSGNLTLGIGELSGAATASLKGGPTSGRTLTWQVGAKNTNSTFAGAIKNNTGSTALEKVGTGSLTLTGTNTYTGATTVNAGKLVLAEGSLTSNVTVTAGAGFGGNGAVSGNVTFSAGSTLLGNPAVGPLAITGNLNLSSPVAVSPVPGAALAEGTYLLYTYTGTLTGSPSFTWYGSSYDATFNTTVAGQVSITLTAPPRDPADIIWSGSQSAIWDTATSNWNWTGGPTRFLTGDRALLDDSSAVNVVTISGTLSPASITVDATKNYTLSGTGSFSGDATLAKDGSGTLTLSSANSHTGGTTVRAGTVTLGNDTANEGAFGTGPITLEGGVVQMNENSTTNSATWNVVVPAGAVATLRVDQRINLSGSLSGSGTLNLYIPYIRTSFLANLSPFSGNMNVTTDADGGDLRIGNTAGLPGTALNLAAGVTTQSYGNVQATVPLGAVSGETGSTLSGLNNNNNPVGAYTLTWEIGARGTNATFAGSITNGRSPSITAIRKVGPGIWTLAGPCTYTGATEVISGTLRVAGSATGSNSLSISPGSTLELAETGDMAINGPLTNNGTLRIYGAPVLSCTGTITNNGVLDMINASGSLPPNLQNNGTILRAADVRVTAVSRTNSTMKLSVHCFPGHNYRLQSSSSLESRVWTDVPGSAFSPVSETPHEFVDPASSGDRNFYRIAITP